MAVKYHKIDIEDPDEREPAFDFNTIFTYERPDYFSYGKPNKDKYQSAFTYKGSERSKLDKVKIEPPQPAGAICQVWAAVVTIIFYGLVFLTLPLSYFFAFKRIQQHERYVIYRLGRMLATKGPGLVILLPIIDSYTNVDLRLKAFSIPPLGIMTSDDATIEVGAEVFYHVKDPVLVVTNVKDLNHCLRNLSRSSMAEMLGNHKLKDVKSAPNKRTLELDLLGKINETFMPWGIEITRLELSEIRVICEDSGMNPHQSPMEVLKAVLGGGNTGMPGLDSNNPIQQMASHLFSQMGQTGGGDAPLIQPHLLNNALSITDGTTHGVSGSGDGGGVAQLTSAEDLLHAIRPHLSEELVADYDVIYKFNVDGPNGGTFFLDLKHGCGDVGRGEPYCEPDVTLSLKSDVLVALLQGQMSTMSAYMSGCLAVEGDTSVASRLSEIIALVRN